MPTRDADPETQIGRKAERLAAALRVLRRRHSHLTVGQTLALLSVATHPGVRQTELAARSGLSLSSLARYLLDLSDTRRRPRPGLGLVRPLDGGGYALTVLGERVLAEALHGL